MKLLVPRGGGAEALLDDEDWARFVRFDWANVDGYFLADFAVKSEKPKQRKKPVRLYLHRLIAAPEPGWHVIHKNGIHRDNRRHNLDVVTNEEYRHMSKLEVRICMTVFKQQLWVAEKVLLDALKKEGG